MAAYCRICAETGNNTDTYVACNNCGSLVCRKHHLWWGTSKNAFCTECFPRQAAAAATIAASGFQAADLSETEQTQELAGHLENMIWDWLTEMDGEIHSGLLRERLFVLRGRISNRAEVSNKYPALEFLIALLFDLAEELRRRDPKRQ